MNTDSMNAIPPAQKEKPAVTLPEKLLLLGALAIGIALDRLIAAGFPDELVKVAYSAFWLVYLAVYSALNWARMSMRWQAWLIGGAAVALCVWMFFFDQEELSALNLPAIPALLMLHAQLGVHSAYDDKDWPIVWAWILGWFAQPFSAIGKFFRACGSLVGHKQTKNAHLRRVLLGLLLAVPLLLVALPLLTSADSVFRFYAEHLFSSFEIGPFVGHLITVFVVSLLFYSFLWNSRWKPDSVKVMPIEMRWDAVIVGVALGILAAVYALFAVVQFAYLFGSAGLPAGLSYSEYARSGFFQLLIVAGFNLTLFGLCLSFAPQSRAMKGVLAALLAMTGVMLGSSMARLLLYIGAYGLTFLRVFSMWFLFVITVVLVLCVVRLFYARLRLLRVTIGLFAVTYVLLCYADVDRLIRNYNSTHDYEVLPEDASLSLNPHSAFAPSVERASLLRCRTAL